MAKHTQTIGRQIADELFECAWQFCGAGASRVNDEFESRVTSHIIYLLIEKFSFSLKLNWNFSYH